MKFSVLTSYTDAIYLLFLVVEEKDNGCGEENGDQADRQTEDPVVTDSDVEVEGGKHSTP